VFMEAQIAYCFITSFLVRYISMKQNYVKSLEKHGKSAYDLYPPQLKSKISTKYTTAFTQLIKTVKTDKITGYFIQPHQDDIALSAGGQVRDLVFSGITVKSITVMSHIAGGREHFPFVKKLIAQTGQVDADLYNQLRDGEDERALRILGVSKRINLGYYDLPWRTKSATDSNGNTILSPLYPDVFGVRAIEDETELKPKIVHDLKELVKNDAKAIVFAPLGTGGHLDHLLVRDSCLEAFQNNPNIVILLYNDVPYSLHFSRDEKFLNVNNLGNAEFCGFQQDRIGALFQYPSQIYHLIDQIREWEGTQDAYLSVEEYYFNLANVSKFLKYIA